MNVTATVNVFFVKPPIYRSTISQRKRTNVEITTHIVRHHYK